MVKRNSRPISILLVSCLSLNPAFAVSLKANRLLFLQNTSVSYPFQDQAVTPSLEIAPLDPLVGRRFEHSAPVQFGNPATIQVETYQFKMTEPAKWLVCPRASAAYIAGFVARHLDVGDEDTRIKLGALLGRAIDPHHSQIILYSTIMKEEDPGVEYPALFLDKGTDKVYTVSENELYRNALTDVLFIESGERLNLVASQPIQGVLRAKSFEGADRNLVLRLERNPPAAASLREGKAWEGTWLPPLDEIKEAAGFPDGRQLVPSLRGIKRLQDMDVKGKRVLVRVDFNVPMVKEDPTRIKSDKRIRAALPTIRWLLARGAKVTLASHFGRPKNGPGPQYSLKPVEKRLQELLREEAKVKLAPGCVGSEVRTLSANQGEREIILLENLRFDPREQKKDPQFAQELIDSTLADIVIEDGFGVMHNEKDTSVVILPTLKPSGMGLSIEHEVTVLSGALENPKRPSVGIVGGSKVSGKINVLKAFVERVDTLIIGGAMAYTFLKAAGKPVGKSLVEEDQIDTATWLLKRASERGVHVILPVDHVVTGDIKRKGQLRNIVFEIPDELMGADIGPVTQARIAKALQGAQTILWNGPMGVFETPPFDKGTNKVAHGVAKETKKGAMSFVGGGDSEDAINDAGLSEEISQVSTGGGAMLALLGGEPLPGLEALRVATLATHRPGVESSFMLYRIVANGLVNNIDLVRPLGEFMHKIMPGPNSPSATGYWNSATQRMSFEFEVIRARAWLVAQAAEAQGLLWNLSVSREAAAIAAIVEDGIVHEIGHAILELTDSAILDKLVAHAQGWDRQQVIEALCHALDDWGRQQVIGFGNLLLDQPPADRERVMNLMQYLPESHPFYPLFMGQKSMVRIIYLYFEWRKMKGLPPEQGSAPGIGIVFHAVINELVQTDQQEVVRKMLDGLEQASLSMLAPDVSQNTSWRQRGLLLPSLVTLFLKNPTLRIQKHQIYDYFNPRPSAFLGTIVSYLCELGFLEVTVISDIEHVLLAAEIAPLVGNSAFLMEIKQLRVLRQVTHLFGYDGSGSPEKKQPILLEVIRKYAA